MLSFPNCKINIGLYVTTRREDGYHDLETVFYPLPVKDALEIMPSAGEAAVHITGREIPGESRDNLVWKAYEMMQQQFPEKVPELDIYLHKALPMGAGLGGGSADGAFLLDMLNSYCKLQLSEEQLAALALRLGSDCPFFIRNTPQFATGRGENMQPVSVDLSAYSIQLICPKVHISTGKAFGMLTPKPAAFDLRMINDVPVSGWKDRIANDFEGPVFRMHPELGAIKEQLYAQGALYVSMTGSGSAIYGIFPKAQQAGIESALPIESFYVI